jgi:hypothetical protein
MNTQRPPNIVICMCDQLRAHAVGCYGDPVARTANIDLLASEGIRFNHAVSPNPVCMPARSSILAGQYTRTCAPELGNAIQLFEDGTWGMADCHSWLGAFDGPDDVGSLPWNRRYEPKTAFMAMKQAFVETPPVIRTTPCVLSPTGSASTY